MGFDSIQHLGTFVCTKCQEVFFCFGGENDLVSQRLCQGSPVAGIYSYNIAKMKGLSSREPGLLDVFWRKD